MASTSAPAGPTAKYDLTHTFSPYMDLHLMFPALQFLMEHNLYKQTDLQRSQLESRSPND